MTKLEYARIYNNLYKNLNDFCRLMPCVKCPFYVAGDKCVFEKCRDTLQSYVLNLITFFVDIYIRLYTKSIQFM